MPSVATIPAVELWDKPPCQSGAKRLAYLRTRHMPRLRRAVDRTGAVEFTMLLADTAAALLQVRRIIVVRHADGSAADAYDVFRIDRLERAQDRRGRVVRVSGRDMAYDLGDAGPYYELVGGSRVYTFTDAAKTCSAWVAAVVAHLQAEGFSYVAAGTCDFSTTETLSLSNTSDTEIMDALAEKVRGEWYLERNADTNFRLHLVQTFGSAGATAYVIHGRNLVAARARVEDADQLLAVVPYDGDALAPNDIDTARYNLGVPWKITNVSSNVLTLAPLDGGTEKCIPGDGFWAGLIVKNLRKGYHRMTITTSSYASQTITVDDAGPCANGDEIAFFEAGTSRWKAWVPPATQHYNAAGYAAIPHGNMNRVSAISSNELTLVNVMEYPGQAGVRHIILNEDSLTNGHQTGHNSITNWLKGVRVLASQPVSTATLTAYNFNSNPKTVTVNSTTGWQAGDWLLLETNGSEPYAGLGPYYFAVNIDSVQSGTVLNVSGRYQNINYTGTGSSLSYTARCYRPRANDVPITAMDLVNDKITVSSAATLGVATSDIVECFTWRGDVRLGRYPSPLESSYGARRTVVYATDTRQGQANFLPNPSFERLTGGNADNWLGPSGLAVIPGANEGTGTLNGVKSMRQTYLPFSADRLWLPIESLSDYICIGVEFYNGSYGWAINPVLEVSLHESRGDLKTVVLKSQLDSTRAYTSGAIPADTGGFVWSSGRNPWRPMQVRLAEADASGAGTDIFYVDALALWVATGYEVIGSPPLTGTGAKYRTISGDFYWPDDSAGCALWETATSLLALYDDAPATFDVAVADLARADPVRYGGATFTLGALLRLYDPVLGVDTTVRIVALDLDLQTPLNTRLTLQTMPQRLSRLLA